MLKHPRLAPPARPGWIPWLIALTGLVFGALFWLAPLEEKIGLGFLYALRGAAPPPEQVVILGIDHESATRLQAPDDPRAWPRGLHAEILRRAQQAGAALVVFDVFFSNPSNNPDDPQADPKMARAMRDMGGAILTDYVKPRQLPSGVYMEAMVEPTAELADAALATAPFLLPKDSSGSEFLTFFGNEEGRATLPTMMLLAYTLRTRYDALAALFPTADPGLAAFLKDNAPQPGTPLDFDRVAQTLSDQLRVRPELVGALDRELTGRPLPEAERRMLRSLLRVLSGNEVRYFNHYGPARTFTTLPYHQIIDPTAPEPANPLRGKIVLVGYLEDFQPETTEGLFYTPYSPVSSVELAATALANLLEDKKVQPVFPPFGDLLWFLAWGSGLGLCAQSRSTKRGLVFIAGLGGLYLAVAWTAFQSQGLWLPILVPLACQVPAALLATLSLSYLRRARREETMQSVIHRFIPVEVFSHLTRHQDSGTLPTYGRLVRGVCLATDAGRYTALAETMEPMALARLMNAYYAVIFEPVTRHGGWISDVIGDAMLAIWDDDGQATRQAALEAAREIRQAVRRFEQSHGLVFPIRIGVQHGEMHIGYVGTAERGEIRAVGDTVNTAARLEALNKLLGTHILVAEPVLEGLAVEGVRPLGEFLLAGKSRPISVAELSLAPEDHAGELPVRFEEALHLFLEQRLPEAHTAFTLLALQFPDDGPSRFYHKTCQKYLAEPEPLGYTTSILVEKPDPARIFRHNK